MGFYKYQSCCILLLLIGYSQVFLTKSETTNPSENDISKSVYKTSNAAASTDKNAKPLFRSCQLYKPSVKEEQPANTSVITVTAEDNDPPESGGTVTYKIVKLEGERNYFKIDNRTGEIRTTMPFDRDEPLRQKELYVTVQATDNGRPPLADACTLKISVIDINDNAPSFDQASYNTQVSEDLKENHEVMRVFAYDLDDGENSRLTYSFPNTNREFSSLFKIDSNTGVVYLLQSLNSKKERQFNHMVEVKDNGNPSLKQAAAVTITVVSSDKQPPKIISTEFFGDNQKKLVIKENFADFSKKLVTIVAESNIQGTEADEKNLIFELVKGKTAQTNKDENFLLEPDGNGNTAYIKLVRPLDYETVTEYVLTVRVKNKESMDASINIPISVTDVNDETPSFIEYIKGSVVENDPIGAQAMQVRAIDKDGTSANNIVSYSLMDHKDKFAIDPNTGIITSLNQFDREQTNLYHVRVKATDNSPSAIRNSSEPNSAIQAFQIVIEDRNDNPPKFTQPIYFIHSVSENTDKGKDVGEVKAIDDDTAALIIYSITDGNIHNVFLMENTTGRIKVNGPLDFEEIEKYNLTIQAYDGIYKDTATVIISIDNENDEPPIFEEHDKTIPLDEEKVIPNCIITVTAFDPDKKDKTIDQNIIYRNSNDADFIKVDGNGCVTLIKPLDRDLPYGSPTRQVFIYANDNGGVPNSLNNFTEFQIILNDINDNAPFLNVTEIVWYENQDPGSVITQLSADDYDSPENGPPFTFRLAEGASQDIFDKFEINGDKLFTRTTFDREEKKFYDIPITITDSGSPIQSGTSTLHVIIGDRNDNLATDGSSEIFVYKYKFFKENLSVGRVYVNDLDDWDLNDKVFLKMSGENYFDLAQNDNGMITMTPDTPEGSYTLKFSVEENFNNTKNNVQATVTVTVKEIPEEAVRKSGSVRVSGTTIEEFVQKDVNGKSKKDILQQQVATMLNTSLENVDIFTVLKSPSNNSFVDVRFSAHGSPYYAPERLNNEITQNQDNIERLLDIKFTMISISECFSEDVCPLGYSCTNFLNITDEPAVVFTNQTSFVGIKAIVEGICDCVSKQVNECFNGGTLVNEIDCECVPGFDGPHCELTSIGFNDEGGWAMYPTFDACNYTTVTFSVMPQSSEGLIFYVGPLTYKHAQMYKDFMSLELKDSLPELKINLGQETTTVLGKRQLKVGSPHKVKITYTNISIEMEIDDCKSQCIEINNFQTKGLLNVNGPLQLGGMKYKFSVEQFKMIYGHEPPTTKKFVGCIQNFTYNDFFYNLGAPSDFYKAFPSCNYGVIAAVSFGIDSNFLVAILVCAAILIILMLAVVVHRRKQDNLHEKDNDDTRENIINYEDEGGGECDTNYDLSVFRSNIDEKPFMNSDIGDVHADISGFLDRKKDSCDNNPENLAFDDVRNYAYEGDGNSTGSLSSLASCTDEGDLKFNYLSNFGPRFRKLADMYGEDPSDDDSHDGGEESWC